MEATLRLTDPRDLGPAVARLRRLLDLDADPLAVDELLGADPALAGRVRARPRDPAAGHGRRGRDRVARGARPAGVGGRGPHRGRPAGRRPGRSAAGPRCAIGRTRGHRSAGRVPADHGRAADPPSPDLLFPTAAVIAERGAEVLTGPARRIATVLGLADRAGRRHASCSTPAATRPSCAPNWSRCPASGPWTAGYLAMRVLGDPDELLATDLGGAPRRRRARPSVRSGRPRRGRRTLEALALLRRHPPLARQRRRNQPRQPGGAS